MFDKVRAIRNKINELGLSLDVQVDGGINDKNAPLAIEAGANVLVAGSSVFKAADRRAAISALRGENA
jgi:ribulose-phosphate 3-epimerase